MTTNRSRRGWRWLSMIAGVAAAVGLGGSPAAAQPTEEPAYVRAIHQGKDPSVDPAVKQAACAGCGNGLLAGGPAPMITGPVGSFGGCGDGGCGGCPTGHCVPGQRCYGADCGAGQHNDTHIGRLFNGLYECLCCPDPCYEPRWVALGNAGLFVDHARPQNTTTFRWDAGRNGNTPDRNAWFFPKSGDRGFNFATSEYDYDDLRMITEVGTKKFSLSVDVPYRNVDSHGVNRDGNSVYLSEANFGDIIIGTKSVLVDCEMLLMTFQFKTYTPVGQSSKGLGTGHVSLEPSLLASLKLTPKMYLESQISQWIPIASGYNAGVLHYHFALNRTLCHYGALHVIGTGGLDCYTFQGGGFTTPAPGFPMSTADSETYVSASPGIRFVFCDWLDLGVGASLSLTSDRFADQLYRTEFRIRF